MKVVLFCGGLGTRVRDHSDAIPKPMINIGYRPILWHVMRYYAHFGHKDFILCLGYRADLIKEYFLNYNECLSNDFTLSRGAAQIDMLNRDIDDWRITFVYTGAQSNVGQRLKAVESYLEGEEVFLANYADSVSDLPLPKVIDFFYAHRAVAVFASVKSPQSFHIVQMDDQGRVNEIVDISQSGVWINGGYFVFSKEIFEYMKDGEELVAEPFQRLTRERKLLTYRHEGFWACLDTFKDKERLNQMDAHGEATWELWKAGAPDA